MALPTNVAAAVARRDVEAGFLIKLAFRSATKRVWTGFGQLTTLDGAVWDGLGEIVAIDGLSPSMSGDAPDGTLTVSGVSPDLVRKAIGETGEVIGRPVSVFLQIFENRALSGLPCPLMLRFMTGIEISRQADTRTITITHESPYIGRNNPPAGYYSDRDQQQRFPGDRFCERVPLLFFKRDGWPRY